MAHRASDSASRPPALKVLVADDDDEFREALVEIISSEGWDVWQARDGKEALQHALELQPDVLVLDHRMPALTGAEVVKHLRAKGSRVPVVFVTAAHEIVEIASSVGVRCHLRKPFGFDELAEVLKRAAQGHC